jgi:hypothetical protein
VVGDVDRAAAAGGLLRDADALVEALDLAQDGIERMLQGAVDRIPLRGAQLVEVGVDPLAGVDVGAALAAGSARRLPAPAPPA